MYWKIVSGSIDQLLTSKIALAFSNPKLIKEQLILEYRAIFKYCDLLWIVPSLRTFSKNFNHFLDWKRNSRRFRSIHNHSQKSERPMWFYSQSYRCRTASSSKRPTKCNWHQCWRRNLRLAASRRRRRWTNYRIRCWSSRRWWKGQICGSWKSSVRHHSLES